MFNISKSPPLLSKSKSYDDWLKLITIWQQFTTSELEKQGPATVLSLEGKTQDAVLELDPNHITDRDENLQKSTKKMNSKNTMI